MASEKFEEFLKKVKSQTITHDLSIEQTRVRFEEMMQSYPAAPEVRFEPLTVAKMPACWAFAPDVNRRRILLFFFGGGYSAGTIESHKNLIGRLSAACGAAVLAVQYRLAPEHPFPAALEDALAAYRWLLHHPYARSRIVFSGISAGGGLALALFLKLKQEKIAMPAGGVLLCPWVDLAMKGKSYQENAEKDWISPKRLLWSAEKYAAGKDLSDPLLSPLYGDLSGLPPLFIQTGRHDLLHTEAMELGKKADAKGIQAQVDVWPDMVHSWVKFAPEFPEAQEAIDRAGAFVDSLFQK